MPRRDRRDDIMRAAEKLFTSRRYHEISLDDVVQEAKVGKGTVYRYFQNKDDLFFQTATSGFEELCELLGHMPEEASFEEQLLGACRNISGFFSRRRQLFRMMQSEEARMYWRQGEGRARWTEQKEKLVSAVASIMRRGVRDGRLRGDVGAETLAGLLLGLLRTRAREMEEETGASPSIELVVELFCYGAGCGRWAPRTVEQESNGAGEAAWAATLTGSGTGMGKSGEEKAE